MSVNEAAELHNIPRSTIGSRLRKDGYYPKDKVPSDPTLPSHVVNEIVIWVNKMNDIAFSSILNALPYAIREVCEMFGEHTMFPLTNLPSPEFCLDFLDRHKDVIKDIDSSGEKCVELSALDIDSWVEKLRYHLDVEHSIDCDTFLSDIENSSRIMCCYPLMSLRTKDDLSNSRLEFGLPPNSTHRKQAITVYSYVRADGRILKPFINCKSSMAEQKYINIKFPHCFTVFSRDGLMDSDTLLDYLQLALGEMGARNMHKPLIVFLDQSLHHISLSTLDFCQVNNIIPFYLPGRNITAKLLFGSGVFSRVENNFKERTKSSSKKYSSKASFISLLSRAVFENVVKSMVIKEFFYFGIFPLNPTRLHAGSQIIILRQGSVVKAEPKDKDEPSLQTDPSLTSSPKSKDNKSHTNTPVLQSLKGADNENEAPAKTISSTTTKSLIQTASKNKYKKRKRSDSTSRSVAFSCKKKNSLSNQCQDSVIKGKDNSGADDCSTNQTNLMPVNGHETTKQPRHQSVGCTDLRQPNSPVAVKVEVNAMDDCNNTSNCKFSSAQNQQSSQSNFKESNCKRCSTMHEKGIKDGLKRGLEIAISKLESSIQDDVLLVYKRRFCELKQRNLSSNKSFSNLLFSDSCKYLKQDFTNRGSRSLNINRSSNSQSKQTHNNNSAAFLTEVNDMLGIRSEPDFAVWLELKFCVLGECDDEIGEDCALNTRADSHEANCSISTNINTLNDGLTNQGASVDEIMENFLHTNKDASDGISNVYKRNKLTDACKRKHESRRNCSELRTTCSRGKPFNFRNQVSNLRNDVPSCTAISSTATLPAFSSAFGESNSHRDSKVNILCETVTIPASELACYTSASHAQSTIATTIPYNSLLGEKRIPYSNISPLESHTSIGNDSFLDSSVQDSGIGSEVSHIQSDDIQSFNNGEKMLHRQGQNLIDQPISGIPSSGGAVNYGSNMRPFGDVFSTQNNNFSNVPQSKEPHHLLPSSMMNFNHPVNNTHGNMLINVPQNSVMTPVYYTPFPTYPTASHECNFGVGVPQYFPNMYYTPTACGSNSEYFPKSQLSNSEMFKQYTINDNMTSSSTMISSNSFPSGIGDSISHSGSQYAAPGSNSNAQCFSSTSNTCDQPSSLYTQESVYPSQVNNQMKQNNTPSSETKIAADVSCNPNRGAQFLDVQRPSDCSGPNLSSSEPRQGGVSTGDSNNDDDSMFVIENVRGNVDLNMTEGSSYSEFTDDDRRNSNINSRDLPTALPDSLNSK